MANIKINSKHPMYDGMSITFKAPCDCTAVEGLTVCDEFTTKNFVFKDAHGKALTGLGNLFSEGVYVKAVLDTGNGYAYLQNADNNSFLSGEFAATIGISNPNLLDNWYFGNPVNQRGATEYTGAGYTVDRWQLSGTNAAVKVEDTGLAVTNGGTAPAYFLQRLPADLVEKLKGTTVTFSAIADGVLYTVSMIAPTTTNTGGSKQINTPFGTMRLYLYANGTLGVTFDIYAGKSTIIHAAKLELGTQQTLAHQDADGNWVLNEIPDYNEQLLRCCMSTADSSDTYANNKRTHMAVGATPEDIGAVRTYTRIADLGLTASTVTMDAIFANMAVGSQLLVYSASGWPSGVLPVINGTLFVQKIHNSRITAWFFDTLSGTGVYAGTATAANAFGGWNQLATTDCAVNKAGDTMTGNLAITMGGYPQVTLNDSATGSQGKMQAGGNVVDLLVMNNISSSNNGRYLRIHSSDSVADANTALKYRNLVDGVKVDYNILHTGNVPSPGNFILGSYVGTGTVGSSGPCSITFPFVPKYVVVSTFFGNERTEFTFINPLTTFGVNADTFGLFLDFICSWNDKTLTWYTSGDCAAGDQLNAEGTTYRYIAWGEAF